MKPRNSTPYGSKNKYGVATPCRRTRRVRAESARDSTRARATVLVIGSAARWSARSAAGRSSRSAVLLLVGAEDSGRGLGRAVQGAGRVALAQHRALDRVVQLRGGVSDAGHRR